MIIACDIGGVIKNLINDEPIDDAIAGIKQLSLKHTIIFISKCKDNYAIKTTEWLKKHQLDSFSIYYCEEYKDKIIIANKYKVEVMIDDKLQVLSTFPNHIKCLWFCSDIKKIQGTKKHQPHLLQFIQIVHTWDDIVRTIDTFPFPLNTLGNT